MSDLIVIKEQQEKNRQLLKDTFMKGATDSELQLFEAVCERTQLDFTSRQIYAVSRWDSKVGRNVFTFQCSVDGFRAVADRSNQYEGQEGPFWCGQDGIWTDIWTKKELPFASKVGVWKTGFKSAVWGVAIFSEYAQTTKDGKLTQFWSKMPTLMIAKVAESLALRKAFPNKLSGLYTAEEMTNSIEAEYKKADTEKLGKETKAFIQESIEKKAIEVKPEVIESKPKSLSVEEIAKELKKPVVIEKPIEIVKEIPKPSKQDLEIAKIAQSVSWGDEAEINTAREMISPVGMIKGKKLGELNKATIKTMYEFFNREQRYINQYPEFYNALGLLFKQK